MNNSPKVFDDYDMELSKWRGYVVRALEDMNTEIKSNSETLKTIDGKLTNQTIKVGVIGGIMGLIAGTAITILLHIAAGI